MTLYVVRPEALRCDLTAAEIATMATQQSACQPVKIDNPATQFRSCFDTVKRVAACPHERACHASLREHKRLFLDECEAALMQGYGRGVMDTELSRKITQALADGPLVSSELYATVNPDVASLSREERETFRGHMSMTLARMIRQGEIVKRVAPPPWSRTLCEYRLAETQ